MCIYMCGSYIGYVVLVASVTTRLRIVTVFGLVVNATNNT